MFKIAKDFLFRSHLFRPSYRARDMTHAADILLQNKASFVIFDKDDTLTTLHSFTIKDPIIKKSIELLRSNQIKMIIVSNSVK